MNSPDNEPQVNASIEDIGSGRSAVQHKHVPDENDKNTHATLAREKHQEKIADIQQDRELRKAYADRLLRYLQVYSVVVAAFIVLAGFKILNFEIDDTAISTLVGSKAVAAIGLVGFIAKGLFNKS